MLGLKREFYVRKINVGQKNVGLKNVGQKKMDTPSKIWSPPPPKIKYIIGVIKKMWTNFFWVIRFKFPKNIKWPPKIQDGYQNDRLLRLSFKCRASQTLTSLDTAILLKIKHW